MPLNFESASVRLPQIDIIGKEVPLAALQSTGSVLQDRFDKSYENETKTQALMKRAMQDVADEDKPAAQAAFDLYQKRLGERAEKGDYHNMRWQTLQDAQEFGSIYTGLKQKADLIAKEKEKIATSKDYLSDASREAALKQFQKSLTKASFDKENRILQGLNVNPFKEAADINYAEEFAKIAPHIRTKTSRGADAQIVQQNIGGVPVWVKKSQDGTLEKLSSAEIEKELLAYGRTNANIQATVNRDLDRLGVEDPNERKIMFDQLYKQQASEAAKAMGDMFEVSKDTRKNDITPYFGADASLNKGRQTSMGVPVNTLADSYGVEAKSLRKTLIGSLTGERGNFHNMLGYINENLNNIKDPKQKETYTNFKNTLLKTKNLSADEQAKLSKFFEFGILNDKDAKFSQLGDPKLIKIAAELNQYVGDALSFDNDIENKFQDYTKANQAFQNINLIVPHYQDAESINHLQTWMKHSLDAGDFKPFKGKLDPEADYSLSKVSDRPLGNGTGIVIELKNSKDNSTILVEPKDDRMLQALEVNFPGISSTNLFKNTSDFNNNEERTVSEIIKENGLPQQGVPKQLLNSKIKYTKDLEGRPVYQLLGPGGIPIKESSSYIDLL